jgi:ADP-dependent NAD(P)H-hydrate dehydratase / NAD(P)H-hydrate epimerase
VRSVLTAEEMRAADRRTIEEIGLPGSVLMENAGAAVAGALRRRWPEARRVLVLCGKGNNGGDGFVVARRLLDLNPQVCLFAPRGSVQGDARIHMLALERSGGRLRELPDEDSWRGGREGLLGGADIVVDALLGTGLRNAPGGVLGRVIADVEAYTRRTGIPLVAVDVPSGLSSDTGETPWETLTASLTVTFAAPKRCHVLAPACDRVGELEVADIGIRPEVIAGTGAALWLLERGDAAAAFPPRDPGAHKGSFGHLLVVAGSLGKTGAAVLSASAALRAGAGLVTVATPWPALQLVAAGRAELMTEALPVTASGDLELGAVDRALELARARHAVVLGPGLGDQSATRSFVRRFVAECPRPLLLDADGLNAFAGEAGALGDALRQRAAPRGLTPHPGEMARLVGSSVPEVQARRLEVAQALAAATSSLVVLKGRRSVVADPGGRAAVNPTGNPGMASGGTGDALSGILGALLARGLDAWLAATAGVYLHGLAGDVAAARTGPESTLAPDLIDAVPEAIRRLRAGA